MKDSRRQFIKQGTSLAAAISIGGVTNGIARPPAMKEIESAGSSNVAGLAKDAGMQASEAYFSGMNEQKVALLKQMEVFGAVGGINAKMAGLVNAQPYEEKSVLAVKNAWNKVGLNFNVVEG